MIEYKCDFCGKVISLEPCQIRTADGYNPAHWSQEFIYHLCPHCFHKMKLFMNIQIRNGRKAAKRNLRKQVQTASDNICKKCASESECVPKVVAEAMKERPQNTIHWHMKDGCPYVTEIFPDGHTTEWTTLDPVNQEDK